jgi:uncharacterized iron-regulated membrane protein
MNTWQRWLQAPQTHWLRRALFQVHLWLGVGLGIYALVIGLSGSALLLKSPFYSWFEPKWIEASEATPLTGDVLTAKMQEVYAGYELGFTMEAYEPNRATYVVLNKNGEYFPHYFNQFTGQDNGAANPWPIKTVEWIAGVHTELLMGSQGRKINGLGGLLLVLMSCTGLILWWQGRQRWYEGLLILPSRQRSVWWQLHSFMGFWALLLMLAWGISGFQLGFPQVINKLVAFFDSNPNDELRPNGWLRFFRNVHFARYGEGAVARWAWIVVSFVPTLLFVSGVVVWWRRVILRRWRPAANNN